MNKKGASKTLVVLGVLVIIFAAGLLYLYINFFKAGPLAVLTIDAGKVQYNAGDRWNDAKSGMTLKQGYSIKTFADSKAKVILSNSVLRLDQNTEISLDELAPEKVSLTQNVGRTWTRLLKISGISNYEIKTPDGIASVRGTGFGLEVKEEGTELEVGDGKVNADTGGENKDIEKDKEIIFEKDSIGLEEKDLEDEDGWVEDNKKLDEEHVLDLKKKLLEKYSRLIKIAQSRAGLTDEQVEEIADRWLNGEISVKEAISSGQIPKEIVVLIPAEFKRY